MDRLDWQRVRIMYDALEDNGTFDPWEARYVTHWYTAGEFHTLTNYERSRLHRLFVMYRRAYRCNLTAWRRA